MSHWLDLTKIWRFLCCHGIKAVTQELSHSNICRLFRKLVSQHIPTFTNADVRRAIRALPVWSRPTASTSPMKTVFLPAQSHHQLQHLFIWSHKAGRPRTRITAWSMRVYHHVAASLYLLDSTELNFGRNKRPATCSQSNPGEKLPRTCHVPPCQTACRHTKQLPLIPCPDMDCRGSLTWAPA